MRAPNAISLAVLLALSGCDSADRPTPAMSEATSRLPDEHAGRDEIVGRASYATDALAADARLQLQLIDLDASDVAHATVAETSVVAEPDGASEFLLPFDPARLRVGGRYGVQAVLLDAEGRRLQATAAPTPVVPGAPGSLALTLLPLASAPAQATSENWQCDELAIGNNGLDPSGRLQLAFSGRMLRLDNDGNGYSDAAGNRFRSEGEQAWLTLAGTPERRCARSERASPWNEAAARGVGFRAVGNEPGWFVEVDMGEAPALRATLDYGERTVQVQRAGALSEGTGYRGKTTDGTPVELSIRHDECHDGMSGEQFEASAQLKVGDKQYQGCGAFLFE